MSPLRRRWRALGAPIRALLLLLLSAGIGLAAFGLRGPLSLRAGALLMRPRTLERAGVVFVMGGDPAVRLPYAMDLLERGYGEELWVATTRVSGPEAAFSRRFGVESDEESLVREALRRSGLARERWRLLTGSVSTWTDIELLKEELVRRPADPVLVVSSPYHFRRIEFVLRRLFGPVGRAPRFYYGYPDPEEEALAYVDQDKLVFGIASEFAKNAAYRLKYALRGEGRRGTTVPVTHPSSL